MVDMVLLITSSPELDRTLIKKAIAAIFKRRKTHEIPDSLQPPPADWKPSYAKLARQCGLSADLDEAFRVVAEFLRSI